MSKKLTQEEFEKRVKALQGDKVDFSNFVYINDFTKGECKCNVCGHVWQTSPMSLFVGSGCPKCAHKNSAAQRKVPLEEVNRIIHSKNENISVIGEYTGANNVGLIKCSTCGHEWRTRVRTLMNGGGCPHCREIQREKEREQKLLEKEKEKEERQRQLKESGLIISYDENVRKKVNEKFNGNIGIIDVQRNGNKTNLLCHCNVCDHEWTYRYDYLMSRGKCPKCFEEEDKVRREEKLLQHYVEMCTEKCKDKGLTDFEFYYDENRKLMVKFYCHNKDIEGVEHGWRVQSGDSFIKTFSCSACAKPSVAYTTEEWVKMARAKYPEFDYSRVNYVDKKTKVTIGCKKHGFIDVNPKVFLYTSACGCPECRKEQLHDEMVANTIEKAKKVHGDKYIYHPELIKSSTEKMGIECPKHGIFYQTIPNHIGKKSGCPHCYKENPQPSKLLTFEEVVERAQKIHGDKYTYHKETYVNTSTNTTVTCPIHGDFQITMHSHLIGAGCNKCGYIERGIKNTLGWEEAFKKIKEAHKCDDYDYSLCEEYYDKVGTKIPVICHKKFKNGEEHGVFWSTATRLAAGQGCPKCRMSILEKDIINLLNENNIKYTYQYYNDDIFNRKSLDFYLEELGIGIECQGEQHFYPVMYRRKDWNKEKAEQRYKEIIERDKLKFEECKNNNIDLIYYANKFLYEHYCKEGYLGPVFWNKDDLMKYINEKANNIQGQ